MDTLGLPIAIQIQAGSVQERDGGPPVIAEAKMRDPRLALVWGDSGFTGRCVEIVQQESGIALEIVKRPNEGDLKRWAPEGTIPELVTPAFKVLPWRWVVERTFGWLGRYRRLSKDYEATVKSSIAWIHIAFIRLLVQRFGEVVVLIRHEPPQPWRPASWFFLFLGEPRSLGASPVKQFFLLGIKDLKFVGDSHCGVWQGARQIAFHPSRCGEASSFLGDRQFLNRFWKSPLCTSIAVNPAKNLSPRRRGTEVRREKQSQDPSLCLGIGTTSGIQRLPCSGGFTFDLAEP